MFLCSKLPESIAESWWATNQKPKWLNYKRYKIFWMTPKKTKFFKPFWKNPVQDKYEMCPNYFCLQLPELSLIYLFVLSPSFFFWKSIFESIQPTINQRRISLAPKSSLTLDVESGILSRQSISCSPRLDKRRPSHQLKVKKTKSIKMWIMFSSLWTISFLIWKKLSQDYIRRLSFNRSEAQCTENIPQPSGLLCAEPNSKQSNLQALQSSLKQSDHQSYSLWPRRQSEVTASSSKLLPTVSSSHSTSRQDRFSVSPVERVPEECVTARPELNQSVDQERSTEKPNESFKF